MSQTNELKIEIYKHGKSRYVGDAIFDKYLFTFVIVDNKSDTFEALRNSLKRKYCTWHKNASVY